MTQALPQPPAWPHRQARGDSVLASRGHDSTGSVLYPNRTAATVRVLGDGRHTAAEVV